MDLNSTTTIVILYIVGTIVFAMFIFLGGKILKIKSGFLGALVISAILCAVGFIGIEYSKEMKKKLIASYPGKANELYLDAEQLMDWKETETKIVQKKFSEAKGKIDSILSKYSSTDLAKKLKKNRKNIAGYSLIDFNSFQEIIAVLIEYENSTNFYENVLQLEQVGSLVDIAELYIIIKNNKKATELLDRALSISETIDFSEDKINSLLKIASLYIKIGRNEKANKLLTIVLEQNQKSNELHQQDFIKLKVASMYIKMQERSKVLNLIKNIRIPKMKVTVLGELAVDYAKNTNYVSEEIILNQLLNAASMIYDSSIREFELDSIRCNYAKNGIGERFNISNILEKTEVIAKQNEQKFIEEDKKDFFEKIKKADGMQQNDQENEENKLLAKYMDEFNAFLVLNGEIGRKYGVGTHCGLIVLEIEKGGVFDKSGGKFKDIISKVDRKNIYSVKDFNEAMEGLGKTYRSLYISVVRNGKVIGLSVRLKAREDYIKESRNETVVEKQINYNQKIPGDYFYGTTGKATIKQLGKRITMELTALPNSAPAPHYIFKGVLDENKIVGNWKFTIRKSRWRKFEASVNSYGEIRIYTIDDKEGHGLRNLVIKPLSTLKKTRIFKNYNNPIGSFIRCEKKVKANLNIFKSASMKELEKSGVYIASMEKDSPLVKAGAQVGDFIINIAGKQVWSSESFAYALNTVYQKNKTIYIVVKKRRGVKYLKVKLN